MIQVLPIRATIDTTPEGMLSNAASGGLYPKFLINIDEYVVITPLGMTLRIVKRHSSQV
jgi:hypothetical protein